ncbi:MAG: prepilin-type N-terminal cleavage/methylation domain-containing protein [bacterium]
MHRKGFSLFEALIALLLSAVVATMIMPFMTTKKINKNLENNSVVCVRKDNGDLTSNACINSVNFATYGRMNAIKALIYFADQGTATEKTAATAVINQVCDNGGEDACAYLADSCRESPTNCANLVYYLNLANDYNYTGTPPARNPSLGRMRMLDIVKSMYNIRNSNIVTIVNNNCCNSSVNTTACSIADVISCIKSWSWGLNTSGQLGDASVTQRTAAVLISGLHVFSSVSAGTSHTCGLDTSGNAWCWGVNTNGQLGDNSTTQRNVPVIVAGSHVFTSISSGVSHSCGLDVTGSAWCWGLNTNGQLGDASTTQRLVPVLVAGSHVFTSISAGGSHTCGVDTAGNAYCWGLNANGQLGDASTTQRTSPVVVNGSHFFTSIDSGGSHSCAIDTIKAAYCWGLNTNGQLGDGTTTQQTAPILVTGLHSFNSISSGSAHTCGVDDSGNAYCWGLNNNGQLGNGTTADSSYPLSISGVVFSSISSGTAHTCGINTSGRAYCWGLNTNGQLGISSTASPKTTPNAVTLIAGSYPVTSISAGGTHTCVTSLP